MSIVGKSEIRVDAFDKATGRTKYYEDRMPQGALYVRIKHSEIAHGFVKSVDTSEAEKIKGVVKVLTCFDAPEIDFPTAGHPWSMDPEHQDVADRRLLNTHVRYWGDDVAVVIAEDEVAAMQGVRTLKVEYEPLPFVLDVQKAMEPGAPVLHDGYPDNILKHTSVRKGNYAEAIKEPGLIKVEGWYDTPTVQHCHIENHGCFAYEENGRITVVSSTQIPHIVRRVVGQAIGRPWADIQIIKPYIGGGFGNKQDAPYEPLCAWCCTQVGGRPVRIDCSREETFVSNRVRHAIRFHIISWIRPDGSMAARKVDLYSNQGAYASHGHSIVAKAMGSFPQLYPCDNMECDAYTVYTNIPAAGAMRAFTTKQKDAALAAIADAREAAKPQIDEANAADVAAARETSRACRLRGRREAHGIRHLTTGVVDTERLLALAHRYEVSVTAFLAAVMAKSVMEIQDGKRPKRRQKPVRITVPVDLRRLFGSRTLRNFSLVLNVGADPRYGDYSVGELCRTIYHRLCADATKQNMAGMMAANVQPQKVLLLRLAPVFVKNVVMDAVYRQSGEGGGSLNVSNLSVLELPEIMRPYVERMEFIIGPQRSYPNNCSVLSYGGKTCINMIRNIRESELERRFFSRLVELGLPVEIESNDRR